MFCHFQHAVDTLRESGEWIRRYPQVVYNTDGSPWKHALPWGDVTVKGNKMFLAVFEWPASGELYLPGLKTKIKSARLLRDGTSETVEHKQVNGWTAFSVPCQAPEKLVSIIEVELDGPPVADPCHGLDPAIKTEIRTDFASVTGAKKDTSKWMEKFGEWKHVERVTAWEANGAATWEVDVVEPGNYQVGLSYAGEGRLVWQVAVEGGESIKNHQNSSHNYQEFPIGWIEFPAPGRYKVSASCVEGEMESASLKSISFVRVP